MDYSNSRVRFIEGVDDEEEDSDDHEVLTQEQRPEPDSGGSDVDGNEDELYIDNGADDDEDEIYEEDAERQMPGRSKGQKGKRSALKTPQRASQRAKEINTNSSNAISNTPYIDPFNATLSGTADTASYATGFTPGSTARITASNGAHPTSDRSALPTHESGTHPGYGSGAQPSYDIAVHPGYVSSAQSSYGSEGPPNSRRGEQPGASAGYPYQQTDHQVSSERASGASSGLDAGWSTTAANSGTTTPKYPPWA